MADKVRDRALNILYNIYEGAYSNIELSKELNESDLKPLDRAFITELVYGTLKWTITLDHIIKNFSSVRENKISPRIRIILRMGLYQIFFMDRVPESAICNESVKLAGRYGHEGTKRFVNGLLRNIVRETGRSPEKIAFPDKSKEPVRFLAARYGYQEWMIKKYLNNHSFDFLEDMLKADGTNPDFSIRVNRLKITRDELLKRLQDKGTGCVPGRFCDEAVILQKPSSVNKIDEFREGLFTVQGESSMLVARVLDPAPGDEILDLCSAPGGKTTHIAELMNNDGAIMASDLFEHRTALVKQTAERLGITIISTVTADAVIFNEKYLNRFDRVLVDAPCSGLGIIRKKPDIKFFRKEEDIGGLMDIQKNILKNAARYVKPGGVLVYSTCTILEEENMDVVKDFTAANRDFQPEDFRDRLPVGLPNLEDARNGWLQLYSNNENMDGFFIARFRKCDRNNE